MKTLILTFAGLFITLMTTESFGFDGNYNTNRVYDGNSFIFVEGGVEFSVFPDGQFDFIYLGNQGSQVTLRNPNVAVTYNSGYNYDAFVQYDSYGAVIQVESVPIYYDNYGRISQAGDVTIRYNNRRLVQVGGLFVHYNPYGYYSHYTGFINPYNRFYVYRPWHAYYAVPFNHYGVVFAHPYRMYYSPVRYSYTYHSVNYYNVNSYTNGRRDFYNPGSRIHSQDGRVAMNRDYRSSASGRDNSASATTYRRDDNILRSTASNRVSTSQRTTATTDSREARSTRENNSSGATRTAATQRTSQSDRTATRSATAERNPQVHTDSGNRTAQRANSATNVNRTTQVNTGQPAVQRNTAVRNNTARQKTNTTVRDTNTSVRNRNTSRPSSSAIMNQSSGRSTQSTTATRSTSSNNRSATSSRGASRGGRG